MDAQIQEEGRGERENPASGLLKFDEGNQEERYWQAIVAKDPEADGRFFYSVKTTGVYCRPSCASRLAKRENVAFHVSAEAAEAAGFRPCKRCDPNGASVSEVNAAKVAKACRIVEAAENLPDLETLATAVGLSRFHFHRIFRKVTGLTPKGYAHAHRAEKMRGQLARNESVTAAIYDAGYNSNGRFYAESAKVLGMKPSRFRAGGAGETIRFGVGECSLGAILVAASSRGVCAILLGDDPEGLVKDLQNRFPAAEFLGGEREFEQWMAKVVGLVEIPGIGLDLPLDLRGTAFQQRVWKALREIPPGETLSYTELAKRIGSPKAFRAVAQACGANALAVAIPCHRVVRNDGGLSGYRWGVERKRALLDREKSGCGHACRRIGGEDAFLLPSDPGRRRGRFDGGI